MKNQVHTAGGTTTTLLQTDIAVAQDSASVAVPQDVERGCTINNIWYSVDFCGLAASGLNNDITAYIWKNPGNNLTAPGPGTYGTSNEKKFIFKNFHAMVMRNQDGNAPVHWEGWLKVPKQYRRMGTADKIEFVVANSISGGTGHFSVNFIYKWFK